MAAILSQLSGIFFILIFGIIMLNWFAPQFFDFLRDIFGTNQQNFKQLEARIAQLETELHDLRQTGDREVMTESSSDEKITNLALQNHLQKAISYQQQTKELIESAPNEPTKLRLQNLSGQITEWVSMLENLAYRVDAIRQNKVLAQDRGMVPKSIERLAEQIEQERDPDIKAALERTLTNRKTQLGSLERLHRLVSQAEIQMENTVASLGTIYSQVLTDQSTNQVADYRHLSNEAEEERRVLHDHLEALTEVKLQAS